MQFKSIIAVLALTVAAVATPVEPVAVNLVARTEPPSSKYCPAGQTLVSKCSILGVPINTTSQNTALVALIQAAISLGLTVQCVLNQVALANNQALCCDLTQGDASNIQNGLINLNLQNVNILAQCNPILNL